MDIVRWNYYYFMIYSGIADTYRNEQYLPKFDKLYELEMLIHSCNLNGLDKKVVKDNLAKVYKYFYYKFFHN
jgi:hypothetical protein